MSPRPGQLVNEHVRLVRLLGKGGMGSVWAGRHEKLALDVAVKFVSSELLDSEDPLVLSRFKREAQLAAKLDSRHTVRILDHGVGDEGPYIVMEHLRGQSLAEAIAKRGRLPVDEAVLVVEQVAAGLAHAHALGIVHRDVKPPNIFLCEDSAPREGGPSFTVKILDFGIAKAESHAPESVATSSGVLIGTPQYMSPEQLMRAGPPDKAADLWALAIVAYEMLTGKPPFLGETLAATLVAITQASLRPASSSVPGLAPALDGFFRRALAADPKRRFESAPALAGAFAEAARGTAPAELPTLTDAPAVDEASLSTGEFLRRQGAGAEDVAFAPTEAHPRGAQARSAPAGRSAAPTRPSAGARDEPGPRSQRVQSARRLSLMMGGVAALAIGVAVVAVVSSGGSTGPSASATSEAVGSAAPAASSATGLEAPSGAPSAPSSAATSAAPMLLGALARRKVEAGFESSGTAFVATFEIAREPGDEGVTLVKAQRACERKLMSLCTEAQWLRACDDLPVLATRPSWTISPGDGGLAVRGGKGACTDRALVRGDAVDPERVGVCCTRGIGMTSQNRNAAFLSTTAEKLLKIERLLNAANGGEVARMAAIKTNFFGKQMTRDEVTETASWIGRSSSFYFDGCAVAIRDDDARRRWTAECTATQIGGSSVASVSRWVRFDDGGLFDELRETKAPTLLVEPPKPTHAK